MNAIVYKTIISLNRQQNNACFPFVKHSKTRIFKCAFILMYDFNESRDIKAKKGLLYSMLMAA